MYCVLAADLELILLQLLHECRVVWSLNEWSPGFLYSPAARLHCWLWSVPSFSWQPTVDFLMGFRSDEVAGQSATLIMSKRVSIVAFGSASRSRILDENQISCFTNFASTGRHEVLSNFRVDSCADFGLYKAQWAKSSRCHGSLITLTGNVVVVPTPPESGI